MSKPQDKYTIRYMEQWTSQPVDVATYVRAYYSGTGMLLIFMFARFINLLAARGFLTAAEVQYIVTGEYHSTTKYADWSPEQESEDGLQPPIIRER